MKWKVGAVVILVVGIAAAPPVFWERMGKLGGGERPPEFLSTHPHPETRVDQLNAWMPEAMKYYRAATGGN